MTTATAVRADPHVDRSGLRAADRWRSLTPQTRIVIGWAVVPAVVLFLIPLILWTGFTGDRASLGGDASLLFFDYPAQWLRNSSTTLASPGGYNAQTQFVPFITMIRLLRVFDLDAEGVLFGSTLAGGFLGTRWLLLELLDRTDRHIQPAATLAGLVYLSLPICSEIVWAAPLPRLFWISLLPLFVSCLLAHQRTGLRRYVTGAVALTVVLAPAATDFPGTIPAVILALTLFVVSVVIGHRRLRKLRTVGFFGSVIAANLFWLIPTALSVNQGAQVGDATSATGKQTATTLIQALAPQQQLTSAMEFRQSHRMMIINNWIQLPVDDWSRHLAILGLIPLTLVIAAAIHGRVRSGMLAALSVVCVVILGAQSTGALPFTQSIYMFLTNHVPGWTAERNFFGTWPVALSLAVALACGVAFVRFCSPLVGEGRPVMQTAPTKPLRSRTWTGRVAPLAALVIAGLMLVYNEPFFSGRVFRLDYTSAIATPRALDALPANYLDAVHFIENSPAGDVMTLPLLSPAWTIVPRGTTQGYVGLSPINYLTNRADYDGLDSFGSTTPSAVSIRTAVTDGNIDGLSQAAGALGVRYVLVNANLVGSTLYGLGAAPTVEAETAETTTLLHDHASHILATFGAWQVRALSAVTIRSPISGTPFPLDPNFSTPIADLAAADTIGLGSSQTGDDACSNISASGSSEHRIVVHTLGMLPACALFLNRTYSPHWQARLSTPSGSQTLAVVRSNADLTAFRLPARTAAGETVTISFAPNDRLADWAYLGATLTLAIAIASELLRRRRTAAGG